MERARLLFVIKYHVDEIMLDCIRLWMVVLKTSRKNVDNEFDIKKE
jgi:hypothetical protein